MKNISFLLIISILLSSCGYNTRLQRELEKEDNLIQVLITSVDSEHIKVEFQFPSFESDSINFCFPSKLPGVNKHVDFTDNIRLFKVYTVDGKPIHFTRKKNIYKIDGKKSRKIEYIVSNILEEKGENYTKLPSISFTFSENMNIINFGAILGYFANKENIKYQVSISLPSMSSTEVLEYEDYYSMLDNPFFSCSKTDTQQFTINDTEFFIDVAQATSYDATYIKNTIYDYLVYVKNNMTLLDNVPNYHFYFYFQKKNFYSAALEHRTSSFYCLQELPIEQFNIQLLYLVSHELLHLMRPLNYCSSLDHPFQFNDSSFTSHLWFYEGVTDYLSLKHLFKSKILSEQEYFKALGMRLFSTSEQSVNLLDLSKNILNKENSSMFFYNNATISALYMDDILLDKSNKNIDLEHFVLKFQKKKRIFKEETFLDSLNLEFREITDKKIQDYLISNDFLNKTTLKGLGLKLTQKVKREIQRNYFTEMEFIAENNDTLTLLDKNSKHFYYIVNNKIIKEELLFPKNGKPIEIECYSNDTIIRKSIKPKSLFYGRKYFSIERL